MQTNVTASSPPGGTMKAVVKSVCSLLEAVVMGGWGPSLRLLLFVLVIGLMVLTYMAMSR